MEKTQPTYFLSWLPYWQAIERLLAGVKNPTLLLGLTGSLSVLVYAILFSQRVNLLTLYAQPRLDGSYPFWGDPAIRWHFIVAFAFLFTLYWLGWRFALVARGRKAWWVVAGGALAFGIALLFMYPFEAADIFDNIMHGRILGIYGQNPFTVPASAFRNDPFYSYMAWKRAASAYGPLWELLAGGMARLAGNGLLANILAFKLLSGLFLVGSILVLALLLKDLAPQRALPGTLLLAWNPLVLYETLGNGHNDITMLFWLLLAVWAMGRQRHSLAVLALTAGALVKFIPLLLLPGAVLISLMRKPAWSERLRWLVLNLLAVLALVCLAYAPFWQGLETLSIARRARLFSASLPAALYHILEPSLGADHAATLVSGTAAVLLLCFCLWRAWSSRQDHSWLNFPRLAFDILMFYLLLTCLWFQQWYALWLIALAAILSPGHRARLGALFSLLVLNKQFVLGPYLLRQRPPIPQPWLEILFAAGLLLVPWLYAAYLAIYKHPQPLLTRNPALPSEQ